MSVQPTVLGQFAAIAQPDGYRFDPVRGAQTTKRWRGPKSKILELLGGLSDAGCTYDCFTQTGAVWEVVATAPGTLDGAVEAPINTWELFSSTVEKDILNSTAAVGISEPDKKRIRAAIQNPPADGSEPSSPALTGTSLTIFRLMTLGITSFPQSYPTIRHTQTVSNRYAVSTAWANVNGIFKTVSLGAPSGFLVALPSSGAGRADAGGFNFGWRKTATQAQTAAYGKVQIVQEWVFNEWSVLLYGALI